MSTSSDLQKLATDIERLERWVRESERYTDLYFRWALTIKGLPDSKELEEAKEAAQAYRVDPDVHTWNAWKEKSEALLKATKA